MFFIDSCRLIQDLAMCSKLANDKRIPVNFEFLDVFISTVERLQNNSKIPEQEVKWCLYSKS